MTAYIFLMLLGGGILGTLGCARIDLMAWKFVRLAGLLACVLLVFVAVVFIMRPPESVAGAWMLRGVQATSILAAVASMVVFSLAPVGVQFHRAIHISAVIGAVLSIIATGFIDRMGGSFVTSSTPLLIARLAANSLSAFLLGSVTVAWLLGHAYLTATKMTIAPLRQLSRFFIYAATARLCFVAGCVAAAYVWADERVAVHFPSAWLILFLRAGAGLVAVMIFAYMVGACVKLRNTQAATGLLYFASVLVYIGEISAQYLMNEWQWPM